MYDGGSTGDDGLAATEASLDEPGLLSADSVSLRSFDMTRLRFLRSFPVETWGPCESSFESTLLRFLLDSLVGAGGFVFGLTTVSAEP